MYLCSDHGGTQLGFFLHNSCSMMFFVEIVRMHGGKDIFRGGRTSTIKLILKDENAHILIKEFKARVRRFDANTMSILYTWQKNGLKALTWNLLVELTDVHDYVIFYGYPCQDMSVIRSEHTHTMEECAVLPRLRGFYSHDETTMKDEPSCAFDRCASNRHTSTRHCSAPYTWNAWNAQWLDCTPHTVRRRACVIKLWVATRMAIRAIQILRLTAKKSRERDRSTLPRSLLKRSIISWLQGGHIGPTYCQP